MHEDDIGAYFKSVEAHRKAVRKKYGVECPRCKELRPKTNASILLPQQRCKVDKYVDPRPRLTNEQYQDVA